jgi:hypothetical protein
MPDVKYPTVEYVRQCLEYQDGKLYWLDRPMEHFSCQMVFTKWGTRYAGREAGCVGMFGSGSCHLPRVIVTIDKVRIYRAVIVWALHNDRWPDNEIDHKDTDSLNDRIENLREATRSQNKANCGIRKNNTSGIKGVGWRKDKNKFRARITVDRQEICLGHFDTEEEAREAYCEAAQKYFGEFSNPG